MTAANTVISGISIIRATTGVVYFDDIKLTQITAPSIPLATTISTSTYYVHTDHLGGLALLTNEAGEAVESRKTREED